jgi:hypothetical protein
MTPVAISLILLSQNHYVNPLPAALPHRRVAKKEHAFRALRLPQRKGEVNLRRQDESGQTNTRRSTLQDTCAQIDSTVQTGNGRVCQQYCPSYSCDHGAQPQPEQTRRAELRALLLSTKSQARCPALKGKFPSYFKMVGGTRIELVAPTMSR